MSVDASFREDTTRSKLSGKTTNGFGSSMKWEYLTAVQP